MLTCNVRCLVGQVWIEFSHAFLSLAQSLYSVCRQDGQTNGAGPPEGGQSKIGSRSSRRHAGHSTGSASGRTRARCRAVSNAEGVGSVMVANPPGNPSLGVTRVSKYRLAPVNLALVIR